MNAQTFQTMNKKEKEDFLSNDLTERIIRIEQRVSAKFGKAIGYNCTEYYKSLNPKQRENFEKYLKSKKEKRVLTLVGFLIPIFAFFLLNVGFTGNFVKDEFENIPLIDYFVVGIILIFFILFLFYRISKNRRDKKYLKYFKIAENLR